MLGMIRIPPKETKRVSWKNRASEACMHENQIKIHLEVISHAVNYMQIGNCIFQEKTNSQNIKNIHEAQKFIDSNILIYKNKYHSCSTMLRPLAF